MNSIVGLQGDIEGPSSYNGFWVLSNSFDLIIGWNKVGKQGFIVDNHSVGAGVKTYVNNVGVGYETMWCLKNVSSKVAGGRIDDGRISDGRISGDTIASGRIV